MKEYSYKVVGVTFDARDGSSRQANLREIFNEDLKEGLGPHKVTFEGYEFEGAGALAVRLDGKEVGNIAADKVQEVAEIAQRAKACDVTLSLNGQELEELVDFYEAYKTRKEDLKAGLITEFDVLDMEEELEELRSSEQIYSAVIHLIVPEEQDQMAADVTAPDPVPEEAKEGAAKKQQSPTTNKIAFILSIAIIVMGLLLILVTPVPGIIFTALGVFFAVTSRKRIKGATGQGKK